jgi:hypothetical protein
VLALIAGLLWAGAAAVKQTGCVSLLAVTLVTLALIILRRSEKRTWALAGGLAWVGFVAGLGGVVLVLDQHGTLAPAWEAVFTFNRGLMNWSDLTSAVMSFSRQQAGLTPVLLGLLLALLGGAATLFGGRESNGLSRPMAIVLVLWWVGQVQLALLGPSGSMRYWQATFPPMIWLAGAGLFHCGALYRSVVRPQKIAVAIMFALFLVFFGIPLGEQYSHGLATSYLTWDKPESQRDRIEEIGTRVMETVPEGEEIYVWSYDAGIYLSAARRPASRFTYPRSPQQMEEILADLEAGEAHAILVPDGPSPYFDRWSDDRVENRLDEVLAAYRKVDPVAGYSVWVRPGE